MAQDIQQAFARVPFDAPRPAVRWELPPTRRQSSDEQRSGEAGCEYCGLPWETAQSVACRGLRIS